MTELGSAHPGTAVTVLLRPGDMVADDDGIAVVPAARRETLDNATLRCAD